MKLLLCALSALVCVLSVAAFPTPGKETPVQCSDPTFACQDLQSAKLCGVVSTCIHDIWETMSVPDPNDEVCDICKEMVKEARDQLLSNMTQEEIKEVFEGSCKLLPIKLIADACIKVVDEIIPQLVEMLASRMDPTMVCTVSGMCFPSGDTSSPEHQLVHFLKLIVTRQKATQCEECTTMMTDVQTFLKNTSEADVKTYLEKACNEKMPKYLCDIVVNTYFHEIYTYIASTDPVKMCSSVGICPQTCELSVQTPGVNDELTCEFCDHLLRHAIDLITANTTLEEFRSALLNFCNHTGTFSSKCTSLVDQYYDEIFDFIKKIDTRGLCTLMGMCDNTTLCNEIPLVKLVPAVEAHRKIPLIRLQPAERIETNNIESIPLVRLVPANSFSKKELKESNDIFQNQLPIERITHPINIFQKDTECALCKAFSFYLELDLAGDKSKDGVRNAINGICDKWMKDYPTHCHALVNNYSLKIQMAIAKGTGFEDLCTSVKMCPLEDTNKGLDVKVIPKKPNGLTCELCKEAMTELEKQLNDPATKQKLKDLAGQACNILPQSMRDDCVSFINQNIDAVIDILQQELKPDNICPALGLCPASLRIPPPGRIKDMECDICKDVVTNFRQKLQDPSAKVMIQTFLEEGCAKLPTSVAGECKKFVDENIDTVMSIIIQEMDPQTVCSILKICPASLPRVKTQRVKDIECDLCKEVVGKVEDIIKDQRTEDVIKSALDKVCGYLPSSISAKCQSFINQYTEVLIELLEQELDPEMICAALNLCPESQKKKEKTQKVKNVECDLCKEVVAKVEDMVKDQKTEEAIKNALDSVCSYLPASMSAKCQKFVNQYTDLVISLLMQELDPDMVCAALNLCPKQTDYAEKRSKAKDLECQSCQAAFHFLQEQLMSAQTQDEVKNLLKRFCELLPSTYANNCDAFIDEYGASLLTLIAQEIDPNSMCFKLQMCDNQTIAIQSALPSLNPFHMDECSICTTVVDYLDKLLEEDDVDKEITQVVEKVCTVLPASFKGKCASILETYGPYILQMIGQMADSKEVCQDIDLCARSPHQIHLIGGNKCTFGPSYWCRSPAHASACKAEEYCQTNVVKA